MSRDETRRDENTFLVQAGVIRVQQQPRIRTHLLCTMSGDSTTSLFCRNLGARWLTSVRTDTRSAESEHAFFFFVSLSGHARPTAVHAHRRSIGIEAHRNTYVERRRLPRRLASPPRSRMTVPRPLRPTYISRPRSTQQSRQLEQEDACFLPSSFALQGRGHGNLPEVDAYAVKDSGIFQT